MAVQILGTMPKASSRPQVLGSLQSTPKLPPSPVAPQGIFSGLVSAGSDLIKQASDRFSTLKNDLSSGMQGGTTGLASGANEIGQVAGLGSDVIGDVVKGLGSTALNLGDLVTGQNIGTGNKAVGTVFQKVLTAPIQQNYGPNAGKTTSIANEIKNAQDQFAQLQQSHPNEAKLFSGFGNTLGFLANFVGLGEGGAIAKEGVTSGIEAAGQAANIAKDTLGEVAAPVAKGVSDLATAAKDSSLGTVAAKKAVDIKDLFANAPANLQHASNAIKEEKNQLAELPKEAQDIVKAGVNIRDARTVLAPKTEDESAFQKEALDQAKAYHSDPAAEHPRAVLGQQIENKADAVHSVMQDVGSKLGDIASKLGTKDVSSAPNDVLAALRKVPGLEKLTLKDGALDFSKTVTAGSQTSGARHTIQSLYNDVLAATEKGGEALHNLRQELFESLNGKKQSLTNLTATEDKATQAIRQGLSDTLDNADKAYKATNKQYATAVKPWQALQNYFKDIAGGDAATLADRGGTLANRLTSRATGGQKLQNIFNQMDSVLTEHGKPTGINIKKGQQFIDMLSHYYNLTPENSLAGQVKQGVGYVPGTVRGLRQRVIRNVVEPFLGSPESKRAAFEKLFELSKSGEALPKVAGQ